MSLCEQTRASRVNRQTRNLFGLGFTGCWINVVRIDYGDRPERRAGGEVAAAHDLWNHGSTQSEARVATVPFFADKEEGFLPVGIVMIGNDHGAADGESEVVLLERCFLAAREEVGRVQGVIAKIVERGTVKFGGPGFRF